MPLLVLFRQCFHVFFDCPLCLEPWIVYLCTSYRSRERIEYKLLSLIYKVLTTSQPTYLSKLFTVQSPRSTRSSSVFTISRPPTSSSLKIINRSFQHAAPCLWNKLPHFLREPHPHLGLSPSHHPTHVGSTLSSLPSPSITFSLFHSRLTTHLFFKFFPPYTPP